MEITKFVVEGRDKALLYGDYSTYHAQLAKRLLNCRKKLGIATRNRGKYHPKETVSAEDVAQNTEYVYLLLLTSERAWAQAMSMKSSHATDEKGLNNKSKSHIVSRLTKASKAASNLVEALSGSPSATRTNDLLEAKAYAALITGAMQFERHHWEPSLSSYSTSRIIYNALATATKGDIFKDLLSETIDPSIRYAAYQLKTPRTVPIPAIARKAFPDSDAALVQAINQFDPTILKQGGSEAGQGASSAENVPKTLTWRSREVNIEDAQIAVAWASVQSARDQLSASLASAQGKQLHEVATSYDGILMATQDAVDATKQAIEEMKGEGVGQDDPRMQSLQITRTAVNYEMISWRIGRNRILTGPRDGATEEYGPLRRRKQPKTAEDSVKIEKELPTGKKLIKLKEKIALYDGTLQNLDSIKELPGVAADQTLAAKLEAFHQYFSALKSLAIARSHAIIGNVANALSLINHAQRLNQQAASHLSGSPAASSAKGPLNVEITSEAAESLSKLLDGELQRHRAIVHINNIRRSEKRSASKGPTTPLIERLNEYPAGGVDMSNIVEFPPEMALIPMKPIFLDVAWNYIDYAGRTAAPSEPAEAAQESSNESAQPAKKGWFGFGR